MTIDTCTQLTVARRLTSNPEALEEDIREEEIEELRQGRLASQACESRGEARDRLPTIVWLTYTGKGRGPARPCRWLSLRAQRCLSRVHDTRLGVGREDKWVWAAHTRWHGEGGGGLGGCG